MSTNNNNSVLVKNVPHTNRFLNANLSNLSSSNMINLQNNSSNNTNLNMNASGGNNGNSNSNRRLPKAINISNSLNTNGLSSNSSFNSYQYSNHTTTNTMNSNPFNNSSSNSQAYFPSMIKGNAPTFTSNNKRFSNDYQQAVRFDYSDAFANNHNLEFIARISQMQRLQIDTVEWERKKRLVKKKQTKLNNATNSTNNSNNLNNNSNSNND